MTPWKIKEFTYHQKTDVMQTPWIYKIFGYFFCFLRCLCRKSGSRTWGKNSVPANQNRCQSLFILMNIVRHAEIASEHVIIWLWPQMNVNQNKLNLNFLRAERVNNNRKFYGFNRIVPVSAPICSDLANDQKRVSRNVSIPEYKLLYKSRFSGPVSGWKRQSSKLR